MTRGDLVVSLAVAFVLGWLCAGDKRPLAARVAELDARAVTALAALGLLAAGYIGGAASVIGVLVALALTRGPRDR